MTWTCSSGLSRPQRTALRCVAAAAVVAGILGASARALGAQDAAGGARSTGNLFGVVRAQEGLEVASAEVSVNGTEIRTHTDDYGNFLLRAVPVGPVTLRVRRLGFRPRTVTADPATQPAGVPLEVVLDPLPLRLTAVEVRAAKRSYSGPMGEFYRRRDAGNGRFFSRAQIDSIRPSRTTDLLRRVPGLHFARARPRDLGTESYIRSRDRRCSPLVWVDGTPAATAYFDPDLVRPETIEGIEVYSGLSTVPPSLLGPAGLGSCGVIAIWTRMGERRPKKADPRVAASRLAALVDSLEVYTAAQVDVAAALDAGTPFEPDYPYELRRTKTPGLVVAEFVVGADGRVEPSTFNIVASSNTLFSDAVDEALESATFRPAMLSGQRVRQLVQLPVRFVLPNGRGFATTDASASAAPTPP